jgi:amidase
MLLIVESFRLWVEKTEWSATKNSPQYLDHLKSTLKGLRFGIKLLGDSIYKQSINTIIKLGGTCWIRTEPMNFDGFEPYTDMKVDLLIIWIPMHQNEITSRSIAEIVALQ